MTDEEFCQLYIDPRGAEWAADRMPTFIARLRQPDRDWGAHYAIDMADLLAGYRAQQAALAKFSTIFEGVG